MSVTTYFKNAPIRISSGNDSFTLPTANKYINTNDGYIWFYNSDTSLKYTVNYGSTQIINNTGTAGNQTLVCSGKYMSGNCVVNVSQNSLSIPVTSGWTITQNYDGGSGSITYGSDYLQFSQGRYDSCQMPFSTCATTVRYNLTNYSKVTVRATNTNGQNWTGLSICQESATAGRFWAIPPNYVMGSSSAINTYTFTGSWPSYTYQSQTYNDYYICFTIYQSGTMKIYSITFSN